MRITEAQGYNKERAFETTGLEVDVKRLTNATISWRKAGAPYSGKKLAEFFEDYIKTKKAYGAYVVVETAVDDTRERPYTVINEPTKGKRKYTTVYQVMPGEFKVQYESVIDEETGEESKVPSKVTVISTGAVEGRADKKDVAIKLAKTLIKENRCNYVIKLVKEVTEGQEYAAYGLYTPSKSAELGKFIFATTE